LVAINGNQPRDLIDYKFLCADEVLELEVLDAAGKTHQIEIEKDYDEDLGLEFDTALFDGLIQCNNRPFCFIDQQPPGKRQSLYLKRRRLSAELSVWFLPYPNQSHATRMGRISNCDCLPLYVSVHATGRVRIQLLKTRVPVKSCSN